MTARILAVRPRRPRPGRLVAVPSGSPSSSSASSRPSRSSPSPSSALSPVRVEWDESRGLEVAVCHCCADSFASPLAGEVEDWAESHRCDPEMAALLALVTSRRARGRAA